MERLRAYPNNRVVMRTSEKFEAKAHAPKMLARSGFLHVENVFSPTTQASGFPWG